MEFHILGPPQVIGEHGPVPLGGRRQRTVLGTLLASPHRLVPLDHLVDAVWGEQPPSTAKRQLQNCVATLRRLLGNGRAGEPLIVGDGPGYRIQPAPGELDAQVFADRVAHAQRLAAQGRTGDAATELRSALDLWRGPALLGLTGHAVETAATRLDEQRLTTHELLFELDLDLGRPDQVIAGAAELIAAHPLRERPVGLYMLALYRTGRQAEALQAYHRFRTQLADELGVDPGSRLQQLHTAILTDDEPAAGPPVGAGTRRAGAARAEAPIRLPVPAQLPADTAGFTGRIDQLKVLDGLVPDGTGPAPVVVAAITGMAGVGKTSLAVHWGHRVSDRFPDGQLYIDLHGYSPDRATQPLEALTHFLHALGVPADQIPPDQQSAAGLYRSVLATRRVLVLLDNAATAEQVRPLLPGGAGCLVLVTSRDRLSSLLAFDGAHRISLDVLTAGEARALLGQILGPTRLTAEPDAIAELARACAYLPLAMRIAATTLANGPQSSVADHVRALTAGDRLAALELDDECPGVRRAFDLSYLAVHPDAQRLFRLLGLAPGGYLTVDAAAALTATEPGAAQRQLTRLTAAHLLAQPSPGRYACHDLLREYAAERAVATESAAERQAALSRFASWYLRVVDAAARQLYPHRARLAVPPITEPVPSAGFGSASEALAWLEGERSNLIALIRHTAGNGLPRIGWLLTDALHGYFQLCMHQSDWAQTAALALAAAEAAGDHQAQAAALLSIGDLNLRQSRYESAETPLRRAVRLSRESDWLEGEAAALGYLGSTLRDQGRIRESADCHRQGLALYRALGSRYGEAVTLNCLGRSAHHLGQLAEAAGYYGQALNLYRAIGSRQGEALVLHDLGEICHQRGQPDAAMSYLIQARELGHEICDRGLEPFLLSSLAKVHCVLGRTGRALELARTAMSFARDLSEPRAEAEALNTVAAIQHHLGRHAEAIDHHRMALNLANGHGDQYLAVEALLGLARAHHAFGQPEYAQSCAESALTSADSAGFQLLADRASGLLRRAAVPA